MAFDFYQSNTNMQAAAFPLVFDVINSGSCDGMAFWFDLHLDEQSSLSSSPFGELVSPLIISFDNLKYLKICATEQAGTGMAK